jgi:hypothetical protein
MNYLSDEVPLILHHKSLRSGNYKEFYSLLILTLQLADIVDIAYCMLL